MTLLLVPVPGKLGMFPFVRQPLGLKMLLRRLPLPLGKGKKKINLIKYPKGSDFLKSAVRHAVNVGPSKVGHSYEFTFAERYRPPPGTRIWSPDVLTFYAASVPGMVCFFEVAFDNGLRFPLRPFMKRVLQHFNICPSQLDPNGWGILVG